MSSLKKELEHLLVEAFKKLNVANGTSFRDLALRHIFAMLPGRTLSLRTDDAHIQAHILAHTFIVRYGDDFWPTDDVDRESGVYEVVVEYFIVLLQLPAQAPHDPLMAALTAGDGNSDEGGSASVPMGEESEGAQVRSQHQGVEVGEAADEEAVDEDFATKHLRTKSQRMKEARRVVMTGMMGPKKMMREKMAWLRFSIR